MTHTLLPAWIKDVAVNYTTMTPDQCAELDGYIMAELLRGTARTEIVATTGMLKAQFNYRRQILNDLHPGFRDEMKAALEARRLANREARPKRKVKVVKVVGLLIAEETPSPAPQAGYGPTPDRQPNPKYADLSDEAIYRWEWAEVRHVADAPKPGWCCWPIGEPGQLGFHFCGRPSWRRGANYCAEHTELATNWRPALIGARGGR